PDQSQNRSGKDDSRVAPGPGAPARLASPHAPCPLVTTASIIPDLARFGPAADAPPPSLEESRRYVARLTTSHYENFSVLSRLVPERLREDFAAVYAYCRWSDDLGDETGADDAARERSLEL